MFKRSSDPEEHNYLYAIPAAAAISAYGAGHLLGECSKLVSSWKSSMLVFIQQEYEVTMDGWL